MFSPEVDKIQGTINAHHVHFTYGDDLDSAALKEGKSGTFEDQMKSIHDRLDETLEAEDVRVFAFCDSDIQIFRSKNSLFEDCMSACPLVLSINVKIWGERTKWFVKDFSVMLFQKRKTCKKVSNPLREGRIGQVQQLRFLSIPRNLQYPSFAINI